MSKYKMGKNFDMAKKKIPSEDELLHSDLYRDKFPQIKLALRGPKIFDGRTYYHHRQPIVKTKLQPEEKQRLAEDPEYKMVKELDNAFYEYKQINEENFASYRKIASDNDDFSKGYKLLRSGSAPRLLKRKGLATKLFGGPNPYKGETKKFKPQDKDFFKINPILVESKNQVNFFFLNKANQTKQRMDFNNNKYVKFIRKFNDYKNAIIEERNGRENEVFYIDGVEQLYGLKKYNKKYDKPSKEDILEQEAKYNKKQKLLEEFIDNTQKCIQEFDEANTPTSRGFSPKKRKIRSRKNSINQKEDETLVKIEDKNNHNNSHEKKKFNSTSSTFFISPNTTYTKSFYKNKQINNNNIITNKSLSNENSPNKEIKAHKKVKMEFKKRKDLKKKSYLDLKTLRKSRTQPNFFTGLNVENDKDLSYKEKLNNIYSEIKGLKILKNKDSSFIEDYLNKDWLCGLYNDHNQTYDIVKETAKKLNSIKQIISFEKVYHNRIPVDKKDKIIKFREVNKAAKNLEKQLCAGLINVQVKSDKDELEMQ